MKLLGMLLLALMVFAGCSSTSGVSGSTTNPTQPSLFETLAQVTSADIDAALADAIASNDSDAILCYPVLKKYIGQPLIKSGDVKGLISLNQKKRDLLLNGGPKIPTDLKQACAAFVQDERAFAMKFAILIGAASHGVPLGMIP